MNLAAEFAQFDEHWSPTTVAVFNGHDVMVVKVEGEFVWHHHDDTDDLFPALKGHLTIRLRGSDVQLGPGELFVVRFGVEHQPFAGDEAELLLIEPSRTPNTGDAATAAERVEVRVPRPRRRFETGGRAVRQGPLRRHRARGAAERSCGPLR